MAAFPTAVPSLSAESDPRADVALFDSALPIHLFLSGPFSQWHSSRFCCNGVEYKNAEMWMMAEKARLFGDVPAEAAILAATTPAIAKARGRLVMGFKADTWDAHKFDIVLQGSRYKFFQNAELAAELLETGAKHLAEANPKDRIWGIGLSGSHPDAQNPSKWRGENLLGRALMQVRREIYDCVWTGYGCDWDRLVSFSSDWEYGSYQFQWKTKTQ